MKLQTDGKGNFVGCGCGALDLYFLNPMACRGCWRLMVQITEASLRCNGKLDVARKKEDLLQVHGVKLFV